MPDKDACEYVTNLPEPLRCEFVSTSQDCLKNLHLINYVSWHYCHLDSRNMFNVYWSILGMILMQTYIVWMMNMAINNYFCPLLKNIADGLRLNESTTGVTILAIAHGSPDLFINVASGLTPNDYSFVLCMAQTMFCYFFSGGMVVLTNPFYVEANYYIRDFGFMLLNTAYLDYVHKRRDGIGLLESIPAALIFVVYVGMAVVDQQLLKAHIRTLEKNRLSPQYDYDDEFLENLLPQSTLPVRRTWHQEDFDAETNPNNDLLRQFWHTIFRFNMARYRRTTMLVKMYMVLKTPVEMLLRLLIPVVDVEVSMYGWSKLLYVLQVNIVPLYITIILGKCGLPEKYSISNDCYIPLSVYDHGTLTGTLISIVLGITVPVSILIFWGTRTDTPPKFFRFTSAFAFLAVILVTYILMSEMYAMFFSLSIILGVSHEFSAATLVNWAISVNKLVASTSLAFQGWPRMAFTAMFSAPVFSCFVYVSLPLLSETIKKFPARFKPHPGAFGEAVVIFLEVGLVFSLLSAMTTNFMMRKACGLFMVTYYLLSLLALVFLEQEIVPAYGP
ncbi:hypothetical protein KR018_007746 [Drosophila ironensis]|nr:hypothetical protein KR018_007746 [Drosophila ironensis]